MADYTSGDYFYSNNMTDMTNYHFFRIESET